MGTEEVNWQVGVGVTYTVNIGCCFHEIIPCDHNVWVRFKNQGTYVGTYQEERGNHEWSEFGEDDRCI